MTIEEAQHRSSPVKYDMTLDNAKYLVEHEPWRWREVMEAAQCTLAAAKGFSSRRWAANAANMLRLFVPLTGDGVICSLCRPSYDCFCVTSEHFIARPHGRDVLALYVRACRLAMGNGWWAWMLDWARNLDACVIGGFPRGYITTGNATVWRVGDPECSPLCPPLPEVTL